MLNKRPWWLVLGSCSSIKSSFVAINIETISFWSTYYDPLLTIYPKIFKMQHPLIHLFSLLAISVLTIAQPATPRGTRPVFVLKDISYSSEVVHSSPEHRAVAEGKISFKLTNTAVEGTALCSGDSSHFANFFYGEKTYYCQVPLGAGPSSFTFSKPDGVFMVNQTWIDYASGEGEV